MNKQISYCIVPRRCSVIESETACDKNLLELFRKGVWVGRFMHIHVLGLSDPE